MGASKGVYVDMIIGRKIAIARINKSISGKQMAAALGISGPQLSNIEAGKTGTSIENLLAVAKILDVGISDILPNRIEYDPPIVNTRETRAMFLEKKIESLKQELEIIKREEKSHDKSREQ